MIQWGVLGETGLVARDAQVAAYLESLGLKALSVRDAISALREVIHRDVGSVAVVDADWSQLSSIAMPMSGDRRLQLLAQSGVPANDAVSAQLVDFLDGLGEEARRNHIRESLAQIVAGVMQMEKFDSAYSQPLYEIGMDSIMGLEIATGIEKTLGLRISAVELSSGPSIDQLAQMLLSRIGN